MNQKLTIGIGDFLLRPKFLGFVEHVGVWVGQNAVLHNTPEKGEHISTLQEFAAGKPCRVERTGADPAAVVARCHQTLAAPKPYGLFNRNCEHTAYEVVRGYARSPMVILGLILGVLLLVVLMNRR